MENNNNSVHYDEQIDNNSEKNPEFIAENNQNKKNLTRNIKKNRQNSSNCGKNFDLKKQLKILLAIPEQDRTDEQWDKINELEILLVPNNLSAQKNHNDYKNSGNSNNHNQRRNRNNSNNNNNKNKKNNNLNAKKVSTKNKNSVNKKKLKNSISEKNSNENSQKNSNVENTEEITAKQEIKTTIKNQHATEKILPIWFNYTIIVLLSLFLMLQIFIFFRNNIAQTFPAFQNVYRALNLSLVGNGNNIEHITIEASDLNNITNNNANLNTNLNTNAKNTTQKTILKLKIMLGNRANFNQNWPLIELNLTDTLDQSIAKYTFTPQDYLNYLIYKNVANELEHNNNLRENYKQEQILYKQYKQKLKYFQAHSEQTIELYIETKNINAAGYKLAVGYL